MGTRRLATIAIVTALCGAAVVWGQGQSGGAVLYDGARIIDGSGGAPIENGAMVVQGGRVTAVGARGAVQAPAGATRIDLNLLEGGERLMLEHLGTLEQTMTNRLEQERLPWPQCMERLKALVG